MGGGINKIRIRIITEIGATTSLPVDHLTATNCNAVAHAKTKLCNILCIPESMKAFAHVSSCLHAFSPCGLGTVTSQQALSKEVGKNTRNWFAGLLVNQ